MVGPRSLVAAGVPDDDDETDMRKSKLPLGTGIQRSLNLVCPNLHMGVRLGSKSCIEKTAEFAVEKFCLSLGQGREPSNLRCSGLTIIAAYERFPARAELLRHACQL